MTDDTTYEVTGARLLSYIERYETLAAEKAGVNDQMKEVMAEAKGEGLDTKIIKKIVALRKLPADTIAEEEAILEMYKNAIGME